MTSVAKAERRVEPLAPGKERRIFGPPGTGKTTTLSKKIAEACRLYGSESVLVSSFSKAAAKELVARDLPLDDRRVGTLHAFAYRLVGSPTIAETKAREFNETLKSKKWHVTPSGSYAEGDDLHGSGGMASGAIKGDALLSRMSALRARMVPRPYIGEVEGFAQRWEAWKAESGYLDFTDLIEVALDEDLGLPVPAILGYFDEAQDFSPLEMALVRRWARDLQCAIVVGDDDQAIYSFKGADPATLLTPLDEQYIHILQQSYRLPPAVKEHAEKWISQVATRQPKTFAPRETEGGDPGLVEYSAAQRHDPSRIIPEIRDIASSGQPVMILTTCSYMLSRVISELRRASVPFHNPYREANGAWNPMRGVAQVRAFFRPDVDVWGEEARPWTWGELWTFLQHMDAKKLGFSRGAKKGLETIAKDSEAAGYPAAADEYEAVTGVPLPRCEAGWLRDHSLEGRLPKLEYGLGLVQRDPTLLLTEPRVVVGTIHSTKGAEADHVYLFPDLSSQGANEWRRPGVGRDAIIRTFYVGLTRARERVVICKPSNLNETVEGL